jgi:ankyrin repeat protein
MHSKFKKILSLLMGSILLSTIIYFSYANYEKYKMEKRISIYQNEGGTILYFFLEQCRNSDLEIIQYLIKTNRIKLNNLYLSRGTTLGIYCNYFFNPESNDYFSFLKILVESGIDLNEEFGTSPLLKAASVEKWEEVKYLIEHKAKVNDLRRGHPYSSVLFIAIKQNNPEIVKYLIEKGANVNSIYSSHEF